MMMMLFRKLLLSITASDSRKASPEQNLRQDQGMQGRCDLHLSHKEITEYGA